MPHCSRAPGGEWGSRGQPASYSKAAAALTRRHRAVAAPPPQVAGPSGRREALEHLAAELPAQPSLQLLLSKYSERGTGWPALGGCCTVPQGGGGGGQP